MKRLIAAFYSKSYGWWQDKGGNLFFPISLRLPLFSLSPSVFWNREKNLLKRNEHFYWYNGSQRRGVKNDKEEIVCEKYSKPFTSTGYSRQERDKKFPSGSEYYSDGKKISDTLCRVDRG